MKPWLRPWPQRLVEALRALFADAEPRVLRNDLARVRRLQKRAAREAQRNPFTAPRRPSRLIDRGFQ